MSKKEEELEAREKALREKLRQVENQQKALKARRKKQTRKDDTRRKIIAGAYAIEHTKKNPDSDFAKIMTRLISEYTIRDTDRALFGLDPLPEQEAANRKTTQQRKMTAEQAETID